MSNTECLEQGKINVDKLQTPHKENCYNTQFAGEAIPFACNGVKLDKYVIFLSSEIKPLFLDLKQGGEKANYTMMGRQGNQTDSLVVSGSVDFFLRFDLRICIHMFSAGPKLKTWSTSFHVTSIDFINLQSVSLHLLQKSLV